MFLSAAFLCTALALFSAPTHAAPYRTLSESVSTSRVLNASVDQVWSYAANWNWAPEGYTNVVINKQDPSVRYLRNTEQTQKLIFSDANTHELQYQLISPREGNTVHIALESVNSTHTSVHYQATTSASDNATVVLQNLEHDALLLDTYAAGFAVGMDIVFDAPCEMIWKHVGNFSDAEWVQAAEWVDFPKDQPKLRILRNRWNMTFPQTEVENFADFNDHKHPQRFVVSYEMIEGFFPGETDKVVIYLDLNSIAEDSEKCLVKHRAFTLPSAEAKPELFERMTAFFRQPNGPYERQLKYFAQEWQDLKAAGARPPF